MIRAALDAMESKLLELGLTHDARTSVFVGPGGRGFQCFFHPGRKQLCVSIFLITAGDRGIPIVYRTNFYSLIISLWPEWQDAAYLERAVSSEGVLRRQIALYLDAFERFKVIDLSLGELRDQILFLDKAPQYIDQRTRVCWV